MSIPKSVLLYRGIISLYYYFGATVIIPVQGILDFLWELVLCNGARVHIEFHHTRADE